MEHRLDKLKFARQKQPYCYFSAATSLFPPELSDARMSWAKSAFLTSVVDDFFDIGGSEEELVNLIQLVEKYVISFVFFFFHFLSVSIWFVVGPSFLLVLLHYYFWLVSVFLVFNRRWDLNGSFDCCSEHVQIIFSAIRSIISEIGVEAFKWQGRSVTNHVIEIVRWNLLLCSCYVIFSPDSPEHQRQRMS